MNVKDKYYQEVLSFEGSYPNQRNWDHSIIKNILIREKQCEAVRPMLRLFLLKVPVRAYNL